VLLDYHIVSFLVRCVLEIRCGWIGVVSVLQAEPQPCVCAAGLPHCFVLGSVCGGDSVWLGWSNIRVAGWSTNGCASACNTDTTPTQPHRTKNETTNVVIQQHSYKLLMMDILLSETCWAHKKWNKIASYIKLVFYSSAISKGSPVQQAKG